jgi:hypothetical protein
MEQPGAQAHTPTTIHELHQWLNKRLKAIEKRVIRSSLSAKGIQPRFLTLPELAEVLGGSSKTISNELSRGEFPIKPIYRNSKPLFSCAAVNEYCNALEQDPSEPAKKRGRKRVCKGEGQEPSRIAELKIKNPGGRRGSGETLALSQNHGGDYET